MDRREEKSSERVHKPEYVQQDLGVSYTDLMAFLRNEILHETLKSRCKM